jgi:hypothetical protein
MSQPLTSRRGLLVIMGAAVIILMFVLVQVINNNRNFDNDLVTGQYSGTVSLQGGSLYNCSITFDGQRLATGVLEYGNESISLKGEYMCSKFDLAISIFSTNGYALVLLGIADSTYTVLSGEAQLRYNSTVLNGTFFLTK